MSDWRRLFEEQCCMLDSMEDMLAGQSVMSVVCSLSEKVAKLTDKVDELQNCVDELTYGLLIKHIDDDK